MTTTTKSTTRTTMTTPPANPANPANPWASAPMADLREIRAVCLDIDDTLSTHGKLTAEAFSALWDLKSAGFAVVPVTGRPAGWCDHIARFWPVDAVVGENGAFTFFMQNGKRRRIDTPTDMAPQTAKHRLSALRQAIETRWPHVEFSADQPYREFDLAIDVKEDVPPWPATEVDALLTLCREAGAEAKLSSIHVNTWFGHYDKLIGLRHWLKNGSAMAQRLPTADEFSRWIFIGDSPNDEPMFAAFPRSVGVANVAPFLSTLTHRPTWITAGESGTGFVEFAMRLIAAQS